MTDDRHLNARGMTEPGWWALYTKHQHEKRVAELISSKGAEVFLPLYDVDRRRWDRTVTLALPLFPSYVFVREQAEMRISILSTPGVHMIVTQGSAYGIVPESEIRNLRLALHADRSVEPCSFLQVGRRVRIVRGALKGLEGILVRQKSVCRVIISVQLLAQSASIEVDKSEIAPIDLVAPLPLPVRASNLQPSP